jgi:hypothetical protein
MGRKSGDKNQKDPGGTEMNVLGKIFGGSQTNLLGVKAIHKQENAKCQAYDCEIHKVMALLADVATSIWRIKSKFSAVDIDGLPDEIKKACRHVESASDALASAEVEVHDHTKEKYVAGMALNVIAFQPSPSVHAEVIAETIKPSIFYRGKLIQRGDVIVETPEKPQSNKANRAEDVCETKERNEE